MTINLTRTKSPFSLLKGYGSASRCVDLELGVLGEKKKIPSHAQITLLPLKGSFQSFQQASPRLLFGSPPWGGAVTNSST